MAKNIYVGNLAWNISSDDLLTLFQAHGAVAQTQVITDRKTGQSSGFGFVTMENDQEAQTAIANLHGTPFHGRPLIVREARSR